MQPRKKSKYDRKWLGAVIGVVGPVIGFFIAYFIKARHMTFDQFMDIFNTIEGARTDVLTMCLVMNLFAFYFIFFRAKWYEASKGLVMITMILAAYVIYQII